jgi:hypothetical protein
MNSNQEAARCVSIGDCAPVSWRMTDRDVLAMFPEEAMHLHAPIRRRPKSLASAAISKITVGAWECTAHFFFGGDALLNEIIVIPLDQNPVGCFESWLMLLAAAWPRRTAAILLRPRSLAFAGHDSPAPKNRCNSTRHAAGQHSIPTTHVKHRRTGAC